MKMKLEEMARQFAQQWDIDLGSYKSGIMGYSDPFMIGYSLRRKRERLVVKKKFPPLPGLVESGIAVLSTPGGNEGILTATVINGRLKDYLALLQGAAEDNLCKALYRGLSGYLDSGNGLFAVIREQLIIGVTLKDVSDLLPRFYPH